MRSKHEGKRAIAGAYALFNRSTDKSATRNRIRCLTTLGTGANTALFLSQRKIKVFAKTDQILANAQEANKMCQKDRDHTDAELSAENAQFRFANLCRAAYEEGYRRKTLEIARNMLNAGMSVERVKKYTDLSDAEIAELQK